NRVRTGSCGQNPPREVRVSYTARTKNTRTSLRRRSDYASRESEEEMGVGGVLSLLWFQKRLPDYAKFICLMLTVDHGPAGDRFSGAPDGAAKTFTEAFDKQQSAHQFFNEMRHQGKLITGIGHRVKSISNPDKRMEILKKFALNPDIFKQETPLLNFALDVERITTAKRGVCLFVSLSACTGIFSVVY
ncbi:unnamed protein product, partial [Mesorhabditis belari]